MDQEIKKMLQESLELAKENNTLLLKLRNAQRWQQITRAVYLLIIIGVTLGAFVYLQPFINQVKGIFTGKSNTAQNLKLGIPDLGSIEKLYDQLNKPKK